MHFRFFSSNMGRFQKPDSNFDNPGANPQGWNLYSYVKGNPVNFNDPTGHAAGLPYRTYSWFSGDPSESYHHVAEANALGGGVGCPGSLFDSGFDAAEVGALGTGGLFYNHDVSPYDNTTEATGQSGTSGSTVKGPDGATWPADHETANVPIAPGGPIADANLNASLNTLGSTVEKKGKEIFEVASVDSAGNGLPLARVTGTALNVDPGKLVIPPSFARAVYQAHGHLQEGTRIGGGCVTLGPSWGDCRSSVYNAEAYERAGGTMPPTYVTQRNAAGVRIQYEFHYVRTSPNLELFWWGTH